MKILPHSWFAGDAVTLAPKLLGKIVRRGACAGIIVETEAYTTDAASHAFKITPRSAPMRDTYGSWYIYFTYGMHWCANVTTNKGGAGAVLIRAVEPIEGIEIMKRRRMKGKSKEVSNGCSQRSLNIGSGTLSNGPAKLCQAFGITGKENRKPVAGEFGIFEPDRNTSYGSVVSPGQIGVSPRIGIKTGTDLPWRFFIKDNPFVSRK